MHCTREAVDDHTSERFDFRMNGVTIASWNVNGLNNPFKRRLVFDKLRKSRAQIFLLQETHSSIQTSKLWKQEWGGDIFFNHGSQSSRGTAFLVDRQTSFKVLKMVSDDDGRFMGIDFRIGQDTLTVGSVYSPTQDKPNDQISFLSKIEDMLQELNGINVLLGGDFNCHLNPILDKNSHTPSPTNSDKTRASLLSFMECHDLSDVWRIRNPKTKSFTFRRGSYASRLDIFMLSNHLTEKAEDIITTRSPHSDHDLISIVLGTKDNAYGPGLWRFDTDLLASHDFPRCYSFCWTGSLLRRSLTRMSPGNGLNLR